MECAQCADCLYFSDYLDNLLQTKKSLQSFRKTLLKGRIEPMLLNTSQASVWRAAHSPTMFIVPVVRWKEVRSPAAVDPCCFFLVARVGNAKFGYASNPVYSHARMRVFEVILHLYLYIQHFCQDSRKTKHKGMEETAYVCQLRTLSLDWSLVVLLLFFKPFCKKGTLPPLSIIPNSHAWPGGINLV